MSLKAEPRTPSILRSTSVPPKPSLAEPSSVSFSVTMTPAVELS